MGLLAVRNAVKILELGALVNGVVWNCTRILEALGGAEPCRKRADMLMIRRPLGERRRRKLMRAWRR
jgi:hypothetical protein